MKTLLDEIVVTEGNREAFERVLNILQKQDAQTLMFMYGPAESGKSTVLRARWRDKDLLAERKVICCHASEVMSAITLGLNDQFLNDIGEVDVLLLDGFEAFFDEEGGPEVFKLLLSARNEQGLDTVVASDKPFDEFDSALVGDVLANYERVEVAPLDAAGRIAFAEKIEAKYRDGVENAPKLDDEALDFVANEFAGKLDEVRLAVQFLVTKAGFEDGSSIDAAQAREALGK